MLLSGTVSGAVSGAEFAGAMDRIGRFEPMPRLAVAVSGGADSLALCLLAQEWAHGRGGEVLALTVDHGLRPEAGAEAEAVGLRLAGQGIRHAVLRWEGPKPSTGIQEAARAARYRLLLDRCRAEGVLHLLLGHHRDDQAETVLMRLSRGSGVDGLAGMAAVREVGACRLVRPLLGVPRARIEATLAARGQPWLDDPSNRSDRFARARLRHAAAALGREGLTSGRLADTARRCGHARAALDLAGADLLGEAAEIHPEGFVLLDPAPLRAAPAEVALRALAGGLRVVGAAPLPVRRERLERLYGALDEVVDPQGGRGRGRTLGGCRVVPWRGRILLARETGVATGRVPLVAGQAALWDRRFVVRLSADAPAGLVVARLGRAGWLALAADRRDDVRRRMPRPVVEGLPALWCADRLAALPFAEGGAAGSGIVAGHEAAGGTPWRVEVAFVPPEPLCGAAFSVV